MLSYANHREVAVLRSLLSLLQGHRWLLPVVVMLGLLVSILEGTSLSLIIPLLRTLTNNAELEVGKSTLAVTFQTVFSAVPHEFRLALILGAIFVTICLKNLLSYANVAAFSFVDSRVSHNLRVRLFDRVLAMPLSRTEEDRSGRLMNVLETETWRTSQALSLLFSAITSACTAAIFVPLLFLLSWPLTLIALVSVGIIPVIVSVITKEVVELGERSVAANSELATRMWSNLNGLRVIHSFGREEFELFRFADASRAVRDITLRLALISARNGPVAEVLITALIAALALTVEVWRLDVATLAAFVVILYRLQPRIRDLVSARVALLGLQGAVLEVTRLVETPDMVPPARSGHVFPELRRAVRFEGVTFRYEEHKIPALKNVSFEIKRGSTVAIVGSSGAGKSTLLDLLLRFRDPQQGQITVDGRPMGELDPFAWRSRIGIVSQTPYLFDETVRFNILYGRPDANDVEIVDAAKLANADSFISKLPRGYDTLVGERGVRLSGGQGQRIILARALLRNPEVLVLDEATNALDSITEQAFQQALSGFARDRTIIIVAHRLSTIERADHILVLDRGRLVEQGDFSSLLVANGLFTRMYQLQSFAQTTECSEPVISTG
jgi:ATP-binding cassette, subfamily B, bacterial MsbA